MHFILLRTVLYISMVFKCIYWYFVILKSFVSNRQSMGVNLRRIFGSYAFNRLNKEAEKNKTSMPHIRRH